MKKQSKILILSTICMALIVGLLLITYGRSYGSVNVPSFYGMTKAVLQKGSTFDLTDARLRIFARDVEDGDLTDKIKIVNNNVNTSVVGSYEIKYEVTDSENNKTEITVPVSIVENEDGNYYERTVYSLPSVDHMGITGPRGNGMDRQMLGFMMKQNSKIYVKKISGPNNITISNFNTNGNAQTNTTLTTEEKEIKVLKTDDQIDDNLVNAPFVVTQYKVSDPIVIGIRVPNNEEVVELPYYHYKDNEAAFRAYWRSIEGPSVAVIENQSVTFYALPGDVDGFKGFTSLDKGLEFYDNFIEEYDELLGYEYNAAEAYNQNVKSKYFIRGARTHNSSLAYYSVGAIVVNNPRTDTLFNSGWASLHEVGHGYQGGGLKEDRGMGLLEVSNNILAHYVQIRSDMKDEVGGDWLGPISSIEDSINAARLSGKTFRQLSTKEKLYVLVNLLSTYNYKDSYAAVARTVRRLEAEGKSNDYTLAEKYVLAYHEKYHVNAAPYFEAWGEKISEKVKEVVRNDSVLTMIADVAKDTETATNIKTSLQKEGKYSLATNEELEPYVEQAEVKITINIDKLEDIKNKNIVVSNGVYNRSYTITDKEMTISVPAGNYQITLPTPKSGIYNFTKYNYVNIVNNKENNITFDYTSVSDTRSLIDDVIISLRGYYQFGTIMTNNGELKIDLGGSVPNANFGTAEYSHIYVYDELDNLLWDKSITGNITVPESHYSVTYKPGYRVVLNLTEPFRSKVNSSMLGDDIKLITLEKTTTIYLGEYGLYQTDPYTTYVEKVKNFATKLDTELTDEEKAHKDYRYEAKQILLANILNLKEEDKSVYLEQYRHIYNGSAPELIEKTFTIRESDTFDISIKTRATDLEDGTFDLTSHNFKFTSGILCANGKFVIGTHNLNYILTDLDGNTTNGVVEVIVIADEKSDIPETPVTPSTPDTPIFEETPSNPVKPVAPSKPKDDVNDSNNDNEGINNEKDPSVDNGDDKKFDEPEEEVKEEKKKDNSSVYFIITIVLLGLIAAIIKIYQKKNNEN